MSTYSSPSSSADVVSEAAARGFIIGEVVGSNDAIPAAVSKIAASFPTYRDAVRQFAQTWRKTHSAGACVRILLDAAQQ